ncbi:MULTISPECIES: PEGA domain-containing protein [unclassified Meiothermus]|uniref:PEGA domain-containing protein n=1 Tax=unclassified Meiothermus TaxID=370471 RepID=UPI000D7BC317|nr:MULTISPECIES: PEGA domain-containing protein [unclassified Meiothermus]PZA05789.1 PEGA domain-containing protein [Meiothermus sp. Pnk-1]RYM31526.1 PEGA domain-containing protein [Meiothermus sp. PNK-Is4]
MKRINAKGLLATALLSLTGMLALAQPRITPQGIIVNPVPTDLQVKTWVDKDPGKTGNSSYRIGENIAIYAQVNQDAYVYLFNINADGKIDLILPNSFSRDNFLRAGETRRFPPQGANYQFTISGPEGQDQVLAVASKQPLSLSDIADVERGQVRVQGAENLARALSIVVTPIPQQSWVSDVATYWVGRVAAQPPLPTPQPQPSPRPTPPAPPAPSSATLNVNSTPQGAQVIVNGQVVGQTPLSISIRPGRSEVEVRLRGYTPYLTTVQPRPGESVNVFATLQPEVRNGTLLVNSNVGGAEVWINGARSGRTPLQLSLREGTYEVVVRAGGYNEFRTNVRIEADRTVRVDARLTPLQTTLEISVNVNGPVRIFVDGSEVGTTQNGFLRVTVNPNARELVALAPGYRAEVLRLRLDPGDTERIRLNMDRL